MTTQSIKCQKHTQLSWQCSKIASSICTHLFVRNLKSRSLLAAENAPSKCSIERRRSAGSSGFGH